MTPEDIEKLTQIGAESFAESLRRPRECSELEMELKTAMQLKDVACCRELLREKRKVAGEVQGP